MTFQPEWAELFKDKELILAFDNDDAGGQGMARALSFVPEAKVLLIPETPGVKDVSDYVERGGDLDRLLATAKHYDGIDDVRDDRSARLAMWMPTRFHDAYIKKYEEEHFKPTRVPRSGDRSKIEDARAYPIANLLKFTQGKAICPFHTEKSGSLHLYKKENRTYCFGGCGKGYDAIDIYQKLHSVDFKTAMEELCRL